MTARGMESAQQPQQQSLPFYEAEASAAVRLSQLGLALLAIRATQTERVFVKLIYDQTASGAGHAWSPAAGDTGILEHVWGPQCGRTTLWKMRKRLSSRQIIAVQETSDTNGRTLGHSYAIDWAGIGRITGRPCSLSEHGRSLSEPACSLSERARSESEHGSRYISAQAGAPASCCLFVLSSLVDDDDDITNNSGTAPWADVVERAKTLYAAIYAHQRYRKLGPESRELLLQVSLVALRAHSEREDWRGWLDAGERAAAKKQANNPAAFLRVTLERQLLYHLGLVESLEDASALMGKILAKARPIVQRYRRQQVGSTEVAT